MITLVLGSVNSGKTFPNPAKDVLNIELLRPAIGPVTISVYDQQGVRVYQASHAARKSYLLDVAYLVPGVYQVLVQSDAEAQTFKMLK